MGRLEERIKDFVKDQGVDLVAIAGPERLSGPPSINPAAALPGAKSVVTFALPMDVPAIDAFLSKRSSVLHNLDQTRENQRINRIARRTAEFIQDLRYRAAPVAANGNYRRSPDPWSLHPVFSHRLAALASGLGASGWSGNVKCEEYGAAMYLGSVVTDAWLESDPLRYSARHFVDGVCKKCRLCARSCASRMFSAMDEETFEAAGRIHPRGRRGSVDLCKITCFGLHSLSPDKKWSTWGLQWIDEWVDDPGKRPGRLATRRIMLQKGASPGDSTPRFDLIRRLGVETYPQALISGYLDKHPEDRPEAERLELLKEFGKYTGTWMWRDFTNEHVLTCGHCALICGPDLAETRRRFALLSRSGIVAPGPDNTTVVAPTYDEAVALRKKHLARPGLFRRLKDAAASGYLFTRLYAGLPRLTRRS